MTLAGRANTALLEDLRKLLAERTATKFSVEQRDLQGRDLVGNYVSRVLGIPLQLIRVRIVESAQSVCRYDVIVDDDLDPIQATLNNGSQLDEFGRLIYDGSIFLWYHECSFNSLTKFGWALAKTDPEYDGTFYWDDERINSYIEAHSQS